MGKNINKTVDKFMPEEAKKGIDNLMPESSKETLATTYPLGSVISSTAADSLEKKAKIEAEAEAKQQQEQENINANVKRKLSKVQNYSVLGNNQKEEKSFKPFKTLLGE